MYRFKSGEYINKRPRGLDACQQHCKKSGINVSEKVYLYSKMHHHENNYILNIDHCHLYYMFGSHITFCRLYTHSKALHLMKNAWERIILQDYNVGIIIVVVQLLFIIGLFKSALISRKFSYSWICNFNSSAVKRPNKILHRIVRYQLLLSLIWPRVRPTMHFHHTLFRNTNYRNLYSPHTVGLRIKTHEGVLNSYRHLWK